jgi:hypothetical protein
LAEAVARARWPRNHATAQLEPHRQELLRLRQGGASIESLVGGLRLLGVEVGRETIRLWLNRELGLKPAKRRKRREKAEPAIPVPTAPCEPPGDGPDRTVMLTAAGPSEPPGEIAVASPPAVPISTPPVAGETSWEKWLPLTADLRGPRNAQGSN